VLRERTASGIAIEASRPPATRLRRTIRPLTVALVLLAVSAPIRAGKLASRVDLSRATLGLHDPEDTRTGARYRWSAARATIFVPAEARVFTLPLRSRAPFEQRVTIMLDGVPADELRLRDRGWRTVRYVLPSSRSGRYHRIDLDISPTWTPRRDGRALGVMVGDYFWNR
jgi:hypothetical protein